MKAIDIHGHYGICNNNNYDINDSLMSGTIDIVRARASKNNIMLTFVSPLKSLMPYGGDVIGGNEESLKICNNFLDIKFWAVLNPKIDEAFIDIINLIKNNKKAFIGIKIHPTLHKYDIDIYGDKIFSFVEDHDLIVLTHTGCGTPPEKIAQFAHKYKNAKIIMAHLGSSEDNKLTRQIEAFKMAKSQNIYIDTSSCCSIYSGLLEYGVNTIGSANILFGSDTPLHHVGCLKSRIEGGGINDHDKENILYKNAQRLFAKYLK